MVLVGFLFVRGESWYAGGVGGLNDGVEVKRDGLVGLVAEVWEVEGSATGLPLHAGDKFTDLHIEFHRIDMDNIVGTGMAGSYARIETEFNVEVIDKHSPWLFSPIAR